MALKFAVNNSLSAVTSLPTAIPTGSMTLLQTQTASSSSTIDFTSNIDSTYDVYCFKFINIHPETNNASFQVNFRDGGSSFDATKTTTNFRAYNNEAGTDTSLGYHGTEDLAQSTSAQIIGRTIGNDDDQCFAGSLILYNPSSTTFVKHFIANTNTLEGSNYFNQYFIAGYCNTTTVIDGARFSFSSGDIDSGVIKLYGIS
jgi:hypothetical protein